MFNYGMQFYVSLCCNFIGCSFEIYINDHEPSEPATSSSTGLTRTPVFPQTVIRMQNVPTSQDELRVPCSAPEQLSSTISKALPYTDKSIETTSYSTPVTYPSTNISVLTQSDTKEIKDNQQTPVASTAIMKDSVSK